MQRELPDGLHRSRRGGLLQKGPLISVRLLNLDREVDERGANGDAAENTGNTGECGKGHVSLLGAE